MRLSVEKYQHSFCPSFRPISCTDVNMGHAYSMGKESEDRAARWFLLNRTGSRLIAKNYRCRVGEIDLILEEPLESGWELVFLEVRARSRIGMVEGPEGITLKKKRSLQKAIKHFLLDYQGSAKTVRADFIFWDGSGWSHFLNCRLDSGFRDNY